MMLKAQRERHTAHLSQRSSGLAKANIWSEDMCMSEPGLNPIPNPDLTEEERRIASFLDRVSRAGRPGQLAEQLEAAGFPDLRKTVLADPRHSTPLDHQPG